MLQSKSAKYLHEIRVSLERDFGSLKKNGEETKQKVDTVVDIWPNNFLKAIEA